jgi:glycosyltransferase involved in cell wall biosynthesis
VIVAHKNVDKRAAKITRPLKVLVITPALPPAKSGMADLSLRLCNELAKAGIEVHVLTSSGDAISGATVLKIHVLKHQWTWRALAQYWKRINDIQPDVIDILFTGWMYKDHPMITFLPTIIKRFFPHIRLITHIESLKGIDCAKSTVMTRLQRKLVTFWVGRAQINYEYGTILRDSDHIVTLSEFDCFQVSTKIPDLKMEVTVVPPPPIMPILSSIPVSQISKTRASLNITDGQLLLAFYGYIYPGKGIETLLEALAILNKGSARYRLIIIGGSPDPYVLEAERRPNYLQELKALATEYGVGDFIRWTGYIESDSSEASVYLHSADLCVLPFDNGIRMHNSSFSFCAAHALPLVTTRGANTESTFVSGSNALLCPPRNAEAIAHAIEIVCTDKDLREKLANGAKSLVESTFSWKQCVEDTINVYRGRAIEHIC